jgi:hypothetical protein
MFPVHCERNPFTVNKRLFVVFTEDHLREALSSAQAKPFRPRRPSRAPSRLRDVPLPSRAANKPCLFQALQPTVPTVSTPSACCSMGWSPAGVVATNPPNSLYVRRTRSPLKLGPRPRGVQARSFCVRAFEALRPRPLLIHAMRGSML